MYNTCTVWSTFSATMFSVVSTANHSVGAKLSETCAFLSSNIATCFEIAWHSLMACKKKMMLCSVSKLREPHDLSIHLTKILFQLKCKLHIHDMSMPLHVVSSLTAYILTTFNPEYTVHKPLIYFVIVDMQIESQENWTPAQNRRLDMVRRKIVGL